MAFPLFAPALFKILLENTIIFHSFIIMGTMSKNLRKKTISVSYRSRRETDEDRKYARVAESMGKRAVSHHFSRGRSVAFFENGKVVRIDKNNAKIVVGE